MPSVSKPQIRFLTGQHLYGPDTLNQVGEYHGLPGRN
jgi:hypothetical protein